MRRQFLATISFLVFSLNAFSQIGEKTPPCPTLRITVPVATLPGEPLKFIAEIDGEFENSNVEYVWKTEGGKIIKGQGTKSIEAGFDKCETLIKATVEIKGLPDACPNVISETGVISHNRGELIDERLVDVYDKIKFEEEKIKIDNFFKQLEKHPGVEGVIQVPFDKNVVYYIKKLDKYLTRKNYDKSLISYVISYSGSLNTRLWLTRSPKDLPDCNNCEIIKAEDTGKLNEFFKLKTNK